MDDLTVRSGYGRPGIKISSFHGPANKNDKLLHNIANGFNARLLAALIRKSDGRFKFIAQFNKQFSDKYGASCTTANDCVEIRKKSYQEAEADILITGTLSIYGQNAFLTYRATGTENGLILAATSRTTVPLPHPYHKKITFPRVRLPENYRSLLLSEDDHHGCMEVEYFQQSLKSLGYRPGRITGTISSATKRAIKAYQWHHNLPETGIYTCSLFLHVRAQMPAGYGW